MIKYLTCNKSVGALLHKCDPCDTPELGRVRSFVLIKKGTVVSVPLTMEEWTAAIEAGSIIIIPKTAGSFDGGTAKMGEGYGDESERKLCDDYVLNVKDPNFADNSEFWETVEGEVWNLGWRTDTKFWYVDSDCKVSAKSPVEEGLDSRVVWNVEAKWSSKHKPQITDIEPIAELFNCHEVVEDSLPSHGA